jgi:hypothetical protein
MVDEAPAATPLEVTAPIVPPPAIFGRFEDPAPAHEHEWVRDTYSNGTDTTAVRTCRGCGARVVEDFDKMLPPSIAPALDEHDAAVTAAHDVIDEVPAVDPDQAIAYLADVRQRLVDETAVIDKLLEQLCHDPTRRALIRHRAYTTAHPYQGDEAT